MPEVGSEHAATATPSPAHPGVPFLHRCLLVDLEVTLRGRITHVGAVLGDQLRSGTAATGLEFLDALAGLADAVIGHNIVEHDLPRLQATSAGHPLLQLPAIDTLVLSPLAFPANPYHRLVKDYKLVRESTNDPLADARLAGSLFLDEWEALARLRTTYPDLFTALHHLLATTDPDVRPRDNSGRGFELLFRALSEGQTLPTREDALAAIHRWIHARACIAARLPDGALDSRSSRLGLAFALAWLGVAGGNSVLPPWVRRQHPSAAASVREWRCQPCTAPDCPWCTQQHEPRLQLQRWYGFDDFRPEPRAPDGSSLQRRIIESGMRDDSLLAILPTSGGKSLCFQLPALVRHRRTGALTIVISPLQALMKDQVDGLIRRTGNPCAAALYGMLTPPERADVLRRTQLGDIAVLYVSPEQFRNRSFRAAVANREIGCWVFDEAHCLSKWGHDFRPDYLYAARFIREFSADVGVPVAAIACFTATAKQEVKDEILAHFEKETGRKLLSFEGGVERDNLLFSVKETGEHGKLGQVDELLREHLTPGLPGSAVVFRARRQFTETTAEYLRSQDWAAEHFHAGLTPPEKKRIQDEFIAGRIQVICATNAFGMGIDKDDVRLVIHADTPGSLENYLQEAGRAGRDGRNARCVLLFDEEDCEAQFRLGAMSELSRRDIAQILRGIRKASRGRDEVVLTSGELLRDEDLDVSIDPGGMMADTQVRTALAWLERAGFVQRNDNVTSVFQARPLVRTLDEAHPIIARLQLPAPEANLWLAVLREIMNTAPTENLTVDQLALLPEFAALHHQRPVEASGPAWVSSRILKTLDSMVAAGLLKRDTILTAYVRHKVTDHSALRLQRVVKLEHALLGILVETDPDPDTERWLPLSLPLLNQRLLDEGHPTSVDQLRGILVSIAQDGRGFAGKHGSFDLRANNHESLAVRIRRGWDNLRKLSERRARAADIVLQRLLARIPKDAPTQADLLVEFTFEELRHAIESDLVLRSETPDLNATVERSLLFLHEQKVIELRQGLAIFRSAMTLRLNRQKNGQRYGNADFEPLASHYRERILQVHVMGEYARRGLERMEEALELVLAYFRLGREEFVQRYVPLKAAVREHATTAASYERIVSDLENADQIRIVTAPLNRNLLVLAGPGSGKTRTVVHRTAFLLRVHRVRARSILVCCFNRSAALELRSRLVELVGDDARGVTILTYHALALRLLGRSLAQKSQRPGTSAAATSEEIQFDQLIIEATALLKGQRIPPGIESDEIRDRLLAGFEHILVDEYQDIDEHQYQLIAALAGRNEDDPDQKLSILAVGDDDQSIYAFRGANVEFIRRFQSDYEADVQYLVENYRSSRRIVDASNAVIAINRDRMKTGRPIRIDRHRSDAPAGGQLESIDPLSRGRVQVIAVDDSVHEAEAVLAEIRRIRSLAHTPWSSFAVLSSEHRDLALVRAVLERESIPVRWRADRGNWPSLLHFREVHEFLDRIDTAERRQVRHPELLDWLAEIRAIHGAANPWILLLERLVDAWKDEAGEGDVPAIDTARFFRESLVEIRRDSDATDGVILSTVHAAKGTEYDHVLLIGGWPEAPDRRRSEERRRTFYVGMTRARRSLAIFDLRAIRPSLPGQLITPELLARTAAPVPPDPNIQHCEYSILGLGEIFLSFAGIHPDGAPIHRALACLRPGDQVRLRANAKGIVEIVDSAKTVLGKLSQAGSRTWAPRLDACQQVRVLALIRRVPTPASETESQLELRASSWEIPLLEIVWQDPP
jgi:ATP-dependent DNA helicase RecQ